MTSRYEEYRKELAELRKKVDEAVKGKKLERFDVVEYIYITSKIAMIENHLELWETQGMEPDWVEISNAVRSIKAQAQAFIKRLHSRR